MSKPWRMVTLHLGAWIMLAAIWFGNGRIQYGGLTILDWTYLVIILGSAANGVCSSSTDHTRISKPRPPRVEP